MIKYSDKFRNKIDNWERLYNDAKSIIDTRKDEKGILIVLENSNPNFSEKNKLANELVEKCIKEGKKPYIVSPFDFNGNNYENNVIELFQNGSNINGEKINFSEMLLVSEPETCIETMMKFIKGGVVPLVHTAPVRGKTPNFSLECVKLLKKVSEQDNDWVRDNFGDILDTWNDKYVRAKQNMESAYSAENLSSKPRKILIECAAQHPLKMGVLPGEEFKARLDKAIQLYKEEKAKGNYVHIYIPGSLHRIEKNEHGQRQVIQDLIPLSKSGAFYLERNGIPVDDIFSEEKNKELMPQGVYNSADECRVASRIFNDGQYNELLSVVSPGQMLRCGLFYLTFGCIPTFYTAPTKESFHNPVSELTHAIPNVLIESPSWQLKSTFSNATEKDDEIARNARSSRNPSLLPSPEQIVER